MRLPNRFNGYGADRRRRLLKGGIKKVVRTMAKPVSGAVKGVTNVAKGVVGSLTGATAAKAQEKAMRQAQEAARQQAEAAEQQLNAANARSPDFDAIKVANAAGVGSTMLTGSEGVSLGEGSKKKKTLLGE